MKMSGGTIIKRAVAYFIDGVIVTLVAAVLTQASFLNPKYQEYKKYSKEYTKITEKYIDKKIDQDEYVEKVNDLSYDLNRTGYVYTIEKVGIIFLYFGLLAYICKGQTIGKRIMSLQVVSNKEDKKLGIHNYLIRAFILNGVILNLFNIVGAFVKEGVYSTLSMVGSNLDMTLELVILMMILFYKDGMGLHDILAGTKVIDLKAMNKEENKEEVEVIKPKKEKEDNE